MNMNLRGLDGSLGRSPQALPAATTGDGGAGIPFSGSLWIAVCACLLLLVVSAVVYAVYSRRAPETSSSRLYDEPANLPAPVYDPDPFRIETREPETKLLTFAFESLERPGHVPSISTELVPRPAGNPYYALVPCGVSNSRYAIRWQGKYLTMIAGDTLQWSSTKAEPNACWVLTPGFCQDEDYVMLRNASNGHFLRYDSTARALVCTDSPTQRTALRYCWKLRGHDPVASSAAARCGCQYDYNTKSVVCIPCGGPSPTAAPATTPAPFGPWPEMVGWDVDAAASALRQRYPALVVARLSCVSTSSPAACPISASGLPAGQQVAVLRFSPVTNRVLFPPRVEFVGSAAPNSPNAVIVKRPMVHYAAGILPIAWHENQPVFLVGKDVRDGFSDFGGKCERVDRGSPINTAAREFYEETYGMVTSAKAVQHIMSIPGACLCLRSSTQNGYDYHMYVVEVPYIPWLRSSFLKSLRFLQSNNVPRVYCEKLDIQYVTWEMLQTLPKRPVFENTLKSHAAVFEAIAKSSPHTWRAVTVSSQGRNH